MDTEKFTKGERELLRVALANLLIEQNRFLFSEDKGVHNAAVICAETIKDVCEKLEIDLTIKK